MPITGTARLGKKTKDLVKRLGPADIAVIDHDDIDRVSADSLVACGVRAIVNVGSSITGRYPNIGPRIIVAAQIPLLDATVPSPFGIVNEGQQLSLEGERLMAEGIEVASGTLLTPALVEERMLEAEKQLDQQMEYFVSNTIEYLNRQKGALIYDPWVPAIKTEIRGRHALVVVRGYEYHQDLNTLKPYIREVKPVLIAVDGGADALLDEGFKPDIIIGDMDSVSDKALSSGAELIAHAYEDGYMPSAKRLVDLGLVATPWPLAATSEDLGLLLAWAKKADLIVALGTHSNLIEYLDKGRAGMASSFLVRLKVGTKLVDAKGVSKLYRSAPPSWQILVVVLAFLAVIICIIAVSPPLRDILRVIWLKLRFWLGI
ncbi:MAG: putative cytokinetic ring protein SteA [Actinomycetia bacterium]|nr:putative cytokinetic ring protein SteA [Actinomycetes bacterium]